MGDCASKTDEPKKSNELQNRKPLQQKKQQGKTEEKGSAIKLTPEDIDKKRQTMRNNLLQGRADPPASHAPNSIPPIVNPPPS